MYLAKNNMEIPNTRKMVNVPASGIPDLAIPISTQCIVNIDNSEIIEVLGIAHDRNIICEQGNLSLIRLDKLSQNINE